MMKSVYLAGAALLALAACNSGGGTPVPSTEADKLKLASEIATLTSDPKMMDGMFDAMKTSMAPDLSGICEAMSESERGDCTTRLAAIQPLMESAIADGMEQAKAMMPEMMQDMGAIMAEVYTGEELAAMHAFYSLPEGKSIMQKQPEVMAKFMPKVMERMQTMQVDMARKMKERMDTLMREQGFTPPAESPI